MQPGELLQRILVARPAPGSRDAYLRFIPRTEMDIAVAGAGCQRYPRQPRRLHRRSDCYWGCGTNGTTGGERRRCACRY